jgi:mevalonate kinase
MSGRGFGGGKCIVLGEHAVVYGEPAIAAGLDRGVYVTVEPRATGPTTFHGLHLSDSDAARLRLAIDALVAATAEACGDAGVGGVPASFELSVESTLPTGVGLGSSAALSVALTRALAAHYGAELDDAEVVRRANLAEAVFHAHPSGIDAEAATRGGTLLYRRGEGATPLRLPTPIALVIAMVGPSPPTAEMVSGVRARWDTDRAATEPHVRAIGALVSEAQAALAAADFVRLGTLMDVNHEHLQALGVSSPLLDEHVAVARRAGALGAKMTGGGGGGCMIALVREPTGPDTEDVVDALRDIEAPLVFTTTVGT